MTLEVVIAVGGRVLHHVRVVNRGPIGGVYEPGDSEGGNGIRVYDWEAKPYAGQVTHRRSDGAVVLAEVVLAELDEQIELDAYGRASPTSPPALTTVEADVVASSLDGAAG